MRQRVSRRKRRRTMRAIAKGDEPPDPISLGTATLVAAGLGAATSVAVPFINKALTPKAPKLQKPKPLAAGESTTLKPGEKVNLINTSPRGLLDTASTGRRTLLGG